MWPFRSSKGRAIAVVHVGPREVAGGLVWQASGKKMALCATARAAVIHKEGEASDASLASALTQVGDELVRAGAPALRSVAGSGHIDSVYVGLQCPWESSVVETKKIEQSQPFTYSRAMEREVLDGAQAKSEGTLIEKRVAATLLNGYLTKEPYGKQAKHAELVVFVSTMAKEVVQSASAAMRRSFHTREESHYSFCYAATCALQSLHPEIKDFLVLSATASAVEVVSVKRGHIVDAASGTKGTDALLEKVRRLHVVDSNSLPTSHQPGYVAPKPMTGSKPAQDESRREWIESFMQLLKKCAVRHALPRTIFMIVDDTAREPLTAALNHETLRSLWLSDEPVTIVALTPKHLATAVTTTGTAEGSVVLGLLALYAAQQTALQ